MNRVLIVGLSAAATLYALRSREVLPLAAALWEREARLREVERERDGLLRVALTARRPATVARIAGERRPWQGYTEAAVLKLAGLRDCE